jgi:hypothetical protein
LEVKKQESVTLLSNEAEYIAISEVCADFVLLKQVLEFRKVKLNLLIIVRVDNVFSDLRMKYVDSR